MIENCKKTIKMCTKYIREYARALPDSLLFLHFLEDVNSLVESTFLFVVFNTFSGLIHSLAELARLTALGTKRRILTSHHWAGIGILSIRM